MSTTILESDRISFGPDDEQTAHLEAFTMTEARQRFADCIRTLKWNVGAIPRNARIEFSERVYLVVSTSTDPVDWRAPDDDDLADLGWDYKDHARNRTGRLHGSVHDLYIYDGGGLLTNATVWLGTPDEPARVLYHSYSSVSLWDQHGNTVKP